MSPQEPTKNVQIDENENNMVSLLDPPKVIEKV